MTKRDGERTRWTDEMLDELADSVSELRESVSEVKDSVSELRESVSELRESVSEVKDSVEGLQLTAQALFKSPHSNSEKMKLGKQKLPKSGKDRKSQTSVLRFYCQKFAI